MALIGGHRTYQNFHKDCFLLDCFDSPSACLISQTFAEYVNIHLNYSGSQKWAFSMWFTKFVVQFLCMEK